MSDVMVDSIIGGYAEEVREYIPRMTRSVDKLHRKPDATDTLERFHQMVHTIQGASLMIGLTGLSNIAQETEKALKDMIEGRLPVDDAACDALAQVVALLETYCNGLVSTGATPKTLVRETALLFRRLRGDPPEEDDAALLPLLEGLPEQEGGGEAEMEVPPFEFQEPPPLTLPETPEPAPAKPAVSAMPSVADMPRELVDSFFEESREHLEDLDGDLNLLEQQVTVPMEMTPAHKEIVRRIRRAVHTLKGSAAVVGFGNIAAWGHTMEDFLDFLYDHEQTISPDTLALLMESADLLAGIVGDPADPRQDQVDQLSRRYAEIMATAPEAAEIEAPAPLDVIEEPEEPGGDDAFAELFSQKTQTLRVGTERVDELVNLIGELMIAASGLDQQMKLMTDALAEVEIFRARLREVARDMEVGYEVKALGRLADAEPSGDFGDFDSLELDRYSKLNLIIRTLNESVIDIGATNTRMWNLYSEMDGHLNRQRVLMSDLQNKMMRIRMLPMGTLSSKLRRTIREVAKKLGKKIRLSISGEDIELDRLVWERITDPLMHLLRNSADHGIESPETRKAAGKPEIGTIRMEATREGNQVVIRLTDDGAGLDYDTLRRKALKAGFMTDTEDADASDLAALIFKPGLSTRDTISEVSGRGVGMDVVRENIQELKGTIQVASTPGEGVQFIIRIPLTLAALRALLFLVGGQTFAIALNDVLEIQRAAPEQLMNGPKPAIRIGEDVLPRYSLRSILKKPAAETPVDEGLGPIVLIARVAGKRRALEIDGLVGQREIFIKNTGSHLRYVKGVAGVTIMGDGSVIPILNLSDLIDERMGFSAEKEDVAPVLRERPLRIMVTDDSVAIRQVVSRLIEDQGWEAVPAKDGADALDKLATVIPDLMFLDIEMPRMNGYELLSVLSQEPKYRGIPVVMLTSRATAKHREKALSLGAKGFMGKPFKNDEFVDTVLTMTGVIR